MCVCFLKFGTLKFMLSRHGHEHITFFLKKKKPNLKKNKKTSAVYYCCCFGCCCCWLPVRASGPALATALSGASLLQ